MNRSFSEWKAQVMAWLMAIEPKNDEMKRQLDVVIAKFHTLRSRWLSTGLLYLRSFTDYWGVQIPADLLPTREEIARWFAADS